MRTVKLTDRVFFKVFTQEELDNRPIYTTKEHLAGYMGITSYTFDYTLPQQWLDSFIEHNNLDYDLVRSTCFTLYADGQFGKVISGLDTIQALL